ncbi:zinc finger protein 1 homolog [Neocloeon triangulifer]|uniref:zinc finger protein 1 homolog n=1 Tax=Neocloeon triangulifer TaxID=2078957 RepID=UPI00286F01F2|nr:zinc finger protein 1 homolog [Neocloeon triangulifer]XP_059484071.1 zinc finger protein 1 homolog [Neocloeon triangulifer]
MSSGSKSDPWLSEGWPANEINFADFFPKSEYPPHAAPSGPTEELKDCKPCAPPKLGDLGNHALKQAPHNSEYFFDSFKVIPELLVERLHQEYSVNSANSGQHHNYKFLETVDKKFFEWKPNTSNLLSNQDLGCYSNFQKPASNQAPRETEPESFNKQMNMSLGGLSGPFVYQPFILATAPGFKCGCDPKGSHHFLCPNNSRVDTMNDSSKLSDSGSSVGSIDRSIERAIEKSMRPQNIRSNKERPFSCDECGKSFLLKHHLVTHAKVHTGIRPYGCMDCGKTFTHKHCLTTHQRLHSGLRPYHCEECKKSFTLKHHLVTHQRTHSKERPYRCESCGKHFGQRRTLNMHMKLHSGERPFQCPVCDECFAQEEQLVAHSRFHGGNNAFACSDCGQAFARKFELVDHRRTHGHSPYACTICGKEFLQKRTLQQHSKLHDGTKPYICKYCNECFAQMGDLIAHAKIHTCYTCKECGCGFPSHELLIVHLQQHGRVVLPQPPPPKPVPPKKFVCPECGTGFAQKHGLSQHVNRKHKSKDISMVSQMPDESVLLPGPSASGIMEQIKNQVLSEQLRAKML